MLTTGSRNKFGSWTMRLSLTPLVHYERNSRSCAKDKVSQALLINAALLL